MLQRTPGEITTAAALAMASSSEANRKMEDPSGEEKITNFATLELFRPHTIKAAIPLNG